MTWWKLLPLIILGALPSVPEKTLVQGKTVLQSNIGDVGNVDVRTIYGCRLYNQRIDQATQGKCNLNSDMACLDREQKALQTVDETMTSQEIKEVQVLCMEQLRSFHKVSLNKVFVQNQQNNH